MPEKNVYVLYTNESKDVTTGIRNAFDIVSLNSRNLLKLELPKERSERLPIFYEKLFDAFPQVNELVNEFSFFDEELLGLEDEGPSRKKYFMSFICGSNGPEFAKELRKLFKAVGVEAKVRVETV